MAAAFVAVPMKPEAGLFGLPEAVSRPASEEWLEEQGAVEVGHLVEAEGHPRPRQPPLALLSQRMSGGVHGEVEVPLAELKSASQTVLANVSPNFLNLTWISAPEVDNLNQCLPGG